MKPGKQLVVYLDGHLAGHLTQNRSGLISFEYAQSYLARGNPIRLSWGMPLSSTAKYSGSKVSNYLAGLLPDDPSVLERWAQTYGTSQNSPFGLLRHVGRDAAGAVQILPPRTISSDAGIRRESVTWLPDDEVADAVEQLSSRPRGWNTGHDTGRWSLAGAQAKMALFRGEDGRWGIPQDATPTTHVVKPVSLALPDHHINELVCMTVARELGLMSASTEIRRFGNTWALISERYDRLRTPTGEWVRLHQEDFCQALGVHPALKYQEDGGPSISDFASILKQLPDHGKPNSSALRFYQGLFYNMAIGGTDAHAKNYSLMYPTDNTPSLAPFYDLGSALLYGDAHGLKTAMTIGSTRKISKISTADWEATATKLGLDPEEAREARLHVLQNIGDAISDAAKMPELQELNSTFATNLTDAVVAHVARWKLLASKPQSHPSRPQPELFRKELPPQPRLLPTKPEGTGSVVQVPEHTRNGRKVRAYSRRRKQT